ncbi:MAG: N-acetylmuramoyl-L-alanine amidase, partial [Actinoplanes sp.]
MATIPWLVDVLRAAGVQVVVEGDWLNRMRPGSFDPIGVLWHHTASTSSASNPHPALGICINGRSDLAGPLCQALVDYNGVFHVISAGRCNHAGVSGGSGPIPSGDGNTLMIGWEIDYNGVDQQMTAAQYNASIAATAAVLTRLGRDSSYARGHRETSTTGKIDPSFIDLNVMRADVAAKMAGGGAAWSSTVDNTMEGVPVVPYGSGIPKTAKHPNAARLWMDWNLSEEGQVLSIKEQGNMTALKNPPLQPPLFDPKV